MRVLRFLREFLKNEAEMKDEEANVFLRQIDRDSDGSLSMDEFRDALKDLQARKH